jgi:hypothetical protein
MHAPVVRYRVVLWPRDPKSEVIRRKCQRRLFRAGFLLRILLCSQSGDHPENYLAKFGYIPYIKVGKNKILLYSWLPPGTYHQNVAI